MGASESKVEARYKNEHGETCVQNFRELYTDLTSPDHLGTAVDQKLFRNRLEMYFGGPYLEYGHALYDMFFRAETVVDEDLFVGALSHLRDMTQTSDYHLLEEFFFSVFSYGKDTINQEGLSTLLQVAATYAMVIGSELHEKSVLPRDHYLIDSLVDGAWLHADKAKGILLRSNFGHWVSQNCPGLMEGVRQWTISLLAPQEQTVDDSSLPYQLPTTRAYNDSPLKIKVEFCSLAWALSTVLPPIYLGHKSDSRMTKTVCPVGGEWTLLYSSDKHGLSMNRFQHHCFDYKHPTVVTLSCYSPLESTSYKFAIAMDSEWRDGTYYFGGKDFTFVQLNPSFHLLKRGPKVLSLNEKQRGFPTGLRVIKSEGVQLFKVESSFDSAEFLEGLKLNVDSVEVWGCGGAEGAESQRRFKEWEKGQILRRRKVKVGALLETWENSPDRFLLDLGGVTTQRPTEQQQQ